MSELKGSQKVITESTYRYSCSQIGQAAVDATIAAYGFKVVPDDDVSGKYVVCGTKFSGIEQQCDCCDCQRPVFKSGHTPDTAIPICVECAEKKGMTL